MSKLKAYFVVQSTIQHAYRLPVCKRSAHDNIGVPGVSRRPTRDNYPVLFISCRDWHLSINLGHLTFPKGPLGIRHRNSAMVGRYF